MVYLVEHQVYLLPKVSFRAPVTPPESTPVATVQMALCSTNGWNVTFWKIVYEILKFNLAWKMFLTNPYPKFLGLENLVFGFAGALCADGGIAVGVCRQRSESYNSKTTGNQLHWSIIPVNSIISYFLKFFYGSMMT